MKIKVIIVAAGRKLFQKVNKGIFWLMRHVLSAEKNFKEESCVAKWKSILIKNLKMLD